MLGRRVVEVARHYSKHILEVISSFRGCVFLFTSLPFLSRSSDVKGEMDILQQGPDLTKPTLRFVRPPGIVLIGRLLVGKAQQGYLGTNYE